MKRFWVIMVIIALAAVFPIASEAQNPVYNTRNKSNSDSAEKPNAKPSLFNSWGSSRNSSGPMNFNKQPRSARPLVLTNYVSSGLGDNFYGDENNRPPGISRNNYALRISDQQIIDDRAQRDALAQGQLEESLTALASFEDFTALGGTQNTNGRSSTQQSGKPKVFLYKKRDQNQGKPRRVFNSIY